MAVTHGPGLAGSLLVGVNLAKSLAFAQGMPLYGVNHLAGHIFAAWLLETAPEEQARFPMLCLVASGGHTELVLMEDYDRFRLLGQTRDDAAGEALDKAARILGLGYPGGPAIQKAAQGIETEEHLPRAWMPGTMDFSFSGLKTALLHKAQSYGLSEPAQECDEPGEQVRELAAAFQESVVDVLVRKTLAAAKETGSARRNHGRRRHRQSAAAGAHGRPPRTVFP